MRTTYKVVQQMLREIGIVISKRGETHRINFFGGLEDTAYYTTSLPEALTKGIDMAKLRRARSTMKSPALWDHGSVSNCGIASFRRERRG